MSQAWQNGLVIADGGPSLTARRVAAYRLSFARPAAGYGDPAAEDALAADVASGVVTSGRMHDYLSLRTAFFDQAVLGAIEAGTRQIVVGGAGYDGRALRYARAGVRWFEVDHPATQRDKLDRLKRLGIDAGHVTFVAADFTADDVAGMLAAAGLEIPAATLFLLEGVAVYLEADVLQTLLTQFRAVAGVRSQLAISMPAEGTWRASERFRTAVAALGEPVRSSFEPAAAADLLARAGWQPAADSGEGLIRATVSHRSAGAGGR